MVNQSPLLTRVLSSASWPIVRVRVCEKMRLFDHHHLTLALAATRTLAAPKEQPPSPKRSSSLAPTVTISAGVLSGTTTQVANASTAVGKYLGIPFAAPPVGALRFALPEPPAPWASWTAVRDATAYSSACWQGGDGSDLLVGQNEDCLYLNVFTPSVEEDAGRAVMVYIHGGALRTGTAADSTLDGSSFAANQGVVVVTINYRLNTFGFVNAPALPVTERNLGFYDQRMALAWVRDNIAAFGGDPDKVTVFGESSGSTSVSRLVETLVDDPPFRAAILESGWADTAAIMIQSDTFGQGAWDAVVSGVNCTSAANSTADELSCVRGVDAETINYFMGNHSELLTTPSNDNVTCYSYPFAERAKANIAHVPILTGTNAQEGTLFTTSETLEAMIERYPQLAPFEDELAAAYVVGSPGLPNQWYANAAIDTESKYICPTSIITAQTASLGIPVWRYYFNATFPNTDTTTDRSYPVVNGYGAYHSAEIPIVWGTYSSANATADEIALSKIMQKAWADFAKDPYGKGPGWPRYDSGPAGVNGTYQVAALGSPNRNPADWSMFPNGTIDNNCWIYWELYAEYQGKTTWW